ncbi:ABC transporter permease [Pedobacter hartonius]|uniref:Putative ABC transport system permease protein n=1 Tax=Pedobacter hartonius TaxID=425514 RepID=A0A1H4D4D1_9SPHI|nr:ABC transporter permease [Pedobacter hartonius]SEA67605.1 putative ABC transport system permease protein [Pedobacter hartonius]
MIIIRLIGESFRFAADALRQNKLRTMLSLLGITIGIFTIIAVFSGVDTLRNNLQESVDKLGSKTLFVQKWPWGFGGDYPWWKYVNRPEPSFRDYQGLKERMTYVDGISFEVTAAERTVKYRSSSVEGATLIAATPDYNKTWTLNFQEGRYFTDNESKTGTPVVILGAEIANGLFAGEPAIGKKIKVMGRRLTVVGVYKKEGEDMMGMSQDKNMLIPLNFARGVFDVENSNYGPQITVRGQESIALEEVESELQGAMRSVHKIKPGTEDDFALNKTTMITNQLDTMFKMVNIAGWVIGGFSILVGGFGIANIMFVSVKERTNIIGIQKSLGAKNYFILLQFMFEAIALCLLGGLLGLTLVYGLTLVAKYAFDTTVVLYLKNISMGVGISLVIGMISGFWPAYSASRLDPVEAIRS